MEIKKIDTDKKRFLDLLLLADGQEDMIDRYLERGELYVLDAGEAKAACVVISEGGACEIKSLAVAPAHQGKGYGGSSSCGGDVWGALPRSLRGHGRGAAHTLFLRALRLCRVAPGARFFHPAVQPSYL